MGASGLQPLENFMQDLQASNVPHHTISCLLFVLCVSQAPAAPRPWGGRVGPDRTRAPRIPHNPEQF